MLTKKIMVTNKLGLHARASMKLVNLASRFQSEILINYQDRQVHAKSIMNLMVLGASCGTELELVVEGDDEAEALSAIESLFLQRFGEEE